MGEVFFGDPLGSKMTWEPIRIDFSLLGVFRGQFVRGTFKSKAPLRVQFSPALGGEGVGKG